MRIYCAVADVIYHWLESRRNDLETSIAHANKFKEKESSDEYLDYDRQFLLPLLSSHAHSVAILQFVDQYSLQYLLWNVIGEWHSVRTDRLQKAS